jgi:hypothetical protein
VTSPLFKILKRLDDANIHYFLERHRPDTVDITATVVGQRIEISVFDDDRVEVSCFVGNEDVLDEAVLYEMIDKEISEELNFSKNGGASQSPAAKI